MPSFGWNQILKYFHPVRQRDEESRYRGITLVLAFCLLVFDIFEEGWELKKGFKHNLTSWLMITPATLLFGVFVFFAMAYALFVSFHSWNMLRPMVFTGLDNYSRAMHSPEFWNSLIVTCVYAVGTLIPSIVLALPVAMLLNQKLAGFPFYRLAIFIPVVTSMAAAAVVWRYLFEPDVGLFNYLLGMAGIPPKEWLDDPSWALPALMMVGIWKRLGYNAVLFLAGLQNIPSSYYEAAEIDGAGRWAKLRHITIPLLSPTTFFVTIMQVIASFKVFVSVQIMTGGGPLNSTDVISNHLYIHAFRYFRMGYASALSYILFLIIFTATLIQFKWGEKKVHYL